MRIKISRLTDKAGKESIAEAVVNLLFTVILDGLRRLWLMMDKKDCNKTYDIFQYNIMLSKKDITE